MNEKKHSVLITGAGSGIGAATARLFSDHGYEVVLSGRDASKLQTVAGQLKTKCHVIPADLRLDQEVHWLAQEALKESPALGILVNNAGIFERRPFVESDDELWKKMYETHLLASVRLSRYLIPHFLKRKSGVIVNVASTAGLRPVAGVSAYATLKAALIALTQNLALEMAPSGIRVNCVCPGIVETPIHKLAKMNEREAAGLRDQWAALHPLGRAGTPEDIAQAIYHLCGPESPWTTGAVIPVDGGISLT